MTFSNSDFSLSRMLDFTAPIIPALLYMMSSLPYLSTAMFTAFSRSSSFVTSQCTNVVDVGSNSLQTLCAKSSWISAITTLAPYLEKSLAAASPMPLAAPVITATLPSSLK
ncbi:momilactone a synthase [Nicotiana attenuata]|uniref:Momilactone a synthase n=1 Tax=Nicotiana attenuata TaxID=49451 RepID=A0A314L7N7_NICAT|nr:momilactone a synthase [Nicotiana attenuata]